jgi:hypothetical protein
MKLAPLYLALLAALPLLAENPFHEPVEQVKVEMRMPNRWWLADQAGIPLNDDVLDGTSTVAITNPDLTAFCTASHFAYMPDDTWPNLRQIHDAVFAEKREAGEDFYLSLFASETAQADALKHARARWFERATEGLPRTPDGLVVLPTKWGIPCA